MSCMQAQAGLAFQADTQPGETRADREYPMPDAIPISGNASLSGNELLHLAQMLTQDELLQVPAN